jgi:hypothetical protein
MINNMPLMHHKFEVSCVVVQPACHLAHLPVLLSTEELHGGLHANGDGHACKKQQLQWQDTTVRRNG